jgi:hypothetical protein
MKKFKELMTEFQVYLSLLLVTGVMFQAYLRLLLLIYMLCFRPLGRESKMNIARLWREESLQVRRLQSLDNENCKMTKLRITC